MAEKKEKTTNTALDAVLSQIKKEFGELSIMRLGGQEHADIPVISGHTASTARSTLGFATGAAITVNLAGREDLLDIAKSDLPLVVQWTTEPDASFMLDSETARKFKIKKATIEVTDGETVTTVSGLKLTRKSGTMLIVK